MRRYSDYLFYCLVFSIPVLFILGAHFLQEHPFVAEKISPKKTAHVAKTSPKSSDAAIAKKISVKKDSTSPSFSLTEKAPVPTESPSRPTNTQTSSNNTPQTPSNNNPAPTPQITLAPQPEVPQAEPTIPAANPDVTVPDSTPNTPDDGTGLLSQTVTDLLPL